MNSDGAFFIGKTHEVCQDYVFCGGEEILNEAGKSIGEKNNPFVILSDGCSSSPDTDTGSRLLVHAAKHTMHLAPDMNITVHDFFPFYHCILVAATKYADIIKINKTCLDATLLISYTTKEKVIATCFGDGAIAFRYTDDSWLVYSIEYEKSYPHYLNYENDNLRKEKLLSVEGNHKKITKLIISPDREIIKEEYGSENLFEIITANKSDCNLCVLMSDGFNSFNRSIRTDTSKNSASISYEEVMLDVLNFKTSRGKFVHRSMNWFKNQCDKKNWYHNDDISMACLSIE